MRRTLLTIGVVLLAFIESAACYAAGIEEAAYTAFQQARDGAIKRGVLITSGADYERIQRISHRLIASAPEMKSDAARWNWDVAYIRSSKQNAYCLPGGKIVVLSGLVDQLSLTDDELAAVLGHEIAHAALEHGKDSYNQRQIAKVAVGILGIVAAVVGAKHNIDANAAFNATTGLGSVGAEFFALRPYGRERELDADQFGMELSARAGFDPSGAVSLQQKMGAAEGGIPEFLSTHPASETRVQQLQAKVYANQEQFASRRAFFLPVAIAEPTHTPIVGAAAHDQVAAVRAQPLDPVGSQVHAQTLNAEEDPDAVTGSQAATMTSKFMVSGEQYAKSQGCVAPVATMVIRAPTYETFSIKCSDMRALVIRCKDGICAPAS